MFESLIQKQVIKNQAKMVLLVMDGLGGLAREPGGKTELESARTPNLDALASASSLGLTIPVGPGITPGSGPGHLAIFGYDPLQYEIGRGAMEALGVDFDLGPDDLAARGNFCTVDLEGNITDRRAGRLSTEISRELAELLQSIRIEEAEIFIEPVKQHRFAFVLRCPGLNDALTDSDPQTTGIPPLPIRALNPDAEKSARYVNQFICNAQEMLTGKGPANMVLLRGFARLPVMPSFKEKYALNAAAIALNGMYRGVARMVGMDVLTVHGNTIQDEFAALEANWCDYDFFYIHIKKTDTCGESGDFDGKVGAIEEVDALIPRILTLNPDVVVVGGDHSSPAVLRSHSWHPVPVLVFSPYVRPDGIADFGEVACLRGSLGPIPATHIMPIALANAQRISKYGA